MSASQYQKLVDAAERRDAVTEALALVRAVGLEPSVEGLTLLEAIVNGRISTEEARAHSRALAQVSWDPYLDLQTGVLRNRLGIADKAELSQAEAELTGYRLIELQLSPLPG